MTDTDAGGSTAQIRLLGGAAHGRQVKVPVDQYGNLPETYLVAVPVSESNWSEGDHDYIAPFHLTYRRPTGPGPDGVWCYLIVVEW